jgi:hypothetical protein
MTINGENLHVHAWRPDGGKIAHTNVGASQHEHGMMASRMVKNLKREIIPCYKRCGSLFTPDNSLFRFKLATGLCTAQPH